MKKLIALGLLLINSLSLAGDGSIQFKAYTSATVYPVPSSSYQQEALTANGSVTFSTDATHDYFEVFFNAGQYTSPYKNGGASGTATFTIKTSALNESSGCNYHICRIYGTHIQIWSYSDASTNNLRQIIIATRDGVYKAVATSDDAITITSKMSRVFWNNRYSYPPAAPYAITDTTPECIRVGMAAYTAEATYSW